MLIASLALNLLLIGYKAFNMVGSDKANVLNEQQIAYLKGREDVFRSLPNDSAEIVFVGNSLTEGFPLVEMFKNASIKNRGISGEISSNVLNRIDEIVESKPEKIFLSIGVNDLKNEIHHDTLFKNKVAVIETIQECSPSTEIFIQSVLPTSGIYSRLNQAIVQHNEKMKSYCEQNGIAFLNSAPVFQVEGQLKKELTYDGLHLNAAGYKKWASFLAPYVATKDATSKKN